MVKIMDPKTSLQTTLDELQAARADLARLQLLQIDQKDLREKLSAELETLKAGRGARVLAAIEDGNGNKEAIQAARDCAMKAEEVETCSSVLYALEPRLTAARRLISERKAAAFKAESAICQAEAEKRRPEYDRLLKALSDFEECPFTPQGPDQIPQQGGQIQQGTVWINALYIPKTEKLRQQAVFYLRCAELVLEGKPFPINLYSGTPLFPIPDWNKD